LKSATVRTCEEITLLLNKGERAKTAGASKKTA